MLLNRLRVFFFFGKNLLMESSLSTSGLSLRMTSESSKQTKDFSYCQEVMLLRTI